MKKISLFALFLLLGAAAWSRLPYQNPDLTFEERAADLCSRLTLEEKALLMMNSSPAIVRLGIPAFEWWSEGLHGMARNGLSTVFPSCIGMAASFNDSLIGEVFTAVGDEMRARNTANRAAGVMGKYKGLSVWTPTVNIFRDPRWGRGQESYGEDPYMNGRMGLRVVQALQGDTAQPYIKLLACAKHFAVHSGPEKMRHSMNIDALPARDLWETYLPAFKALVDGGVREVMCAYQRFEGDPCCGSNRLLQRILREKWGFGGVVVSDCGAINDFHRPKAHLVSPDATAASALGVVSGTDVECGSVYRNIPAAVRRGDLSEADVDTCVRRLLAERFRLGDFDPDSMVGWTRIPASVIASAAHRDIARRMARQQCVLLKNNGILPLAEDARIMVVGPNAADSTMQWGIYYGQPSHTVTILDGIRAIGGRDIPYRRGCTVTALTEDVSIMDRIAGADGTPGFEAVYWNNTDMRGDTAATARYASPVLLDNGGNTAFAPGVNLTDFTVSMKGHFIAESDEDLDIVFNNDDGLRIIVNGDTIHNRWKSETLNFRRSKLPVRAGQRYDVQVDYMQLDGDATLNFDLRRVQPVDVASVVESARGADAVVFVGGISPAYEREQARVREPGFDDGDRTSIELPQCQRDIIAALAGADIPVVLVNCSGSAIALEPENDVCDAILQAWYPGEEGGTAVAEILYGRVEPSGKLPVTFYRNDSQLPDFEDYTMQGRTYRYLREQPLYPFGHGLSYTTFDISRPEVADGKVSVRVRNTGAADGTEIVQLYVRRTADTDGPVRTLRNYKRIDIAAGAEATVTFDLNDSVFESWDEASQSMAALPGEYELALGNSSDSRNLKTVKITR